MGDLWSYAGWRDKGTVVTLVAASPNRFYRLCAIAIKSVGKFGQFYGNAIPLKVRWSGNREYIREFSVKGPKLGLTCKFVSSVLTLFSPKNSSRGNVRCLSKYWQKRAVSSNFTDWLAIVKFFTFHCVKSRKIYWHTNFGCRSTLQIHLQKGWCATCDGHGRAT